MIDRAIRELDRERMGLQAQEKKTVMEIKKMAKDNQMDAVKVMAKSVVRNRNAVTKLYQLKSQLQAVSLRMAELKSTQAMSDAIRGSTRAMAAMNRQMQLPALAKIMREFERQNAKMEYASEAMGSAMDMAFEGEGEEEETDELVSQVLDEIGIATTADMATVPMQPAGPAAIPNQAAPQLAAAIGAPGIGNGSGRAGGAGPGGAGPPAGSGNGGGGGIPLPPAAGGNDDDEFRKRLERLRNDP